MKLFKLILSAWAVTLSLAAHAQTITNVNTSTPNSGSGDPLYTAFNKINTNFSTLTNWQAIASNSAFLNLNGHGTNECLWSSATAGVAFRSSTNTAYGAHSLIVDDIPTAGDGSPTTGKDGSGVSHDWPNHWRGPHGIWHDSPWGNKIVPAAAHNGYNDNTAFQTPRMAGIAADSYWNDGGSASAKTDLIDYGGPGVWSAQKKPCLLVGIYSKGSDVIYTCHQNCFSNAFKFLQTNGLLAAFTNAGVQVAFNLLDGGWEGAHRSSGYGLLTWETTHFPTQSPYPTNLTWWLATNNCELWLETSFIPHVANPANWPHPNWSEVIGDGSTQDGLDGSGNMGIWEYPNGPTAGVTNSSPFVLITPDSIHKDIATLYSWGVQGLTFQHGGVGVAANFMQMVRCAVSAIQIQPVLVNLSGVPDGGNNDPSLTEYSWNWNEFTYKRGFPVKHQMILTMLAASLIEPPTSPPGAGSFWPASFSPYVNNWWDDSNEQTTKPAGVGDGLALVVETARPKLQFLTNVAPANVRMMAEGDAYADFDNYTYGDFKNYLSGVAVMSMNMTMLGNTGVTNGAYDWINAATYRGLVTNSLFLRYWQDVSAAPLVCDSWAPSNGVVHKILSDGSALVWLWNEGAGYTTNLTITAAQLGFPSNVNMTITEVWTNLVWSNAVNAVTVGVGGASSQLLRVRSSPLFSPDQIGGLAYFWSYEDLPVGANQTWLDRVQQAPWQQDLSASQPTNDAVSGVYFNGSTWYTNGAGITLPSKYSIWIHWKNVASTGEPCLIGNDLNVNTGFALKLSVPKASVVYGAADHVSYSIAPGVDYDWVYTDAGSGAASSGINYTNAVNSVAITGSATGPTLKFMGNDASADLYNGYIKWVAIWTNTTISINDAAKLSTYAKNH